MKFTASTISALIFTAIATLAFIWMAARTPVKFTALNLGVPGKMVNSGKPMSDNTGAGTDRDKSQTTPAVSSPATEHKDTGLQNNSTTGENKSTQTATPADTAPTTHAVTPSVENKPHINSQQKSEAVNASPQQKSNLAPDTMAPASPDLKNTTVAPGATAQPDTSGYPPAMDAPADKMKKQPETITIPPGVMIDQSAPLEKITPPASN